MILRRKIYLFDVSSVMVVEGNPPAPTELKMLWNASFNASSIKTSAHTPLAYLCVHPCARHCAQHVRRLQRQMQLQSMYYVLHTLFTIRMCFSAALPATTYVTGVMCALNPPDLAAIERVEWFAFNSVTHPHDKCYKAWKTWEQAKGELTKLSVCWLK